MVELIDPVCGMTVDPHKTPYKYVYQNQPFAFCSASCLEKFKKNPEHYLTHSASESAIADEYTCPMHPEIIQDKPGFCPICGMALEPVSPHTENDDAELKLMNRHFWICLVLTLPVLFLAMFHQPLPLISPVLSIYIQAFLTSIVVIWGGWPLLQRAWASVVSLNLNMFSLIGMGVGVAYLYSLIAAFFPSLFPPSFRAEGNVVPVYFEAAAVITTLVLLGQVLELRARRRTSQALKDLLHLAPKTAHLLDTDHIEHTIPLAEVKPEDLLRVKPGESVPVDGVVVEGSSSIDESLLTGESIPVEKGPGNQVIGGTFNKTGSFIMRAEKVGSETMLARIVQMVGEAQRSRAPIQKLADVVSAYFVPIVIAIAILTFLLWSWLGPSPSYVYGIVNAVAVLIIACPCALGLATPVSIMVGVGKGATAGILIKNAEALEMFAKVNTLVVDKTGTLTEGKLKLAHLVPVNGINADQILHDAASLEAASEHPLAEPIVAQARSKKIAISKAKSFESITGKGITGTINQDDFALGNRKLMEDLNIDLMPLQKQAEELQKQGNTVMYLARGRQLLGLIAVSDTIKSSAYEAIKELHQGGLRILMFTGDHYFVAEAVARQLGIDEVRAEMLPQDKIRAIKELQEQGFLVAMAGDGINDAPALSQADVGIAMGNGTDISIESAGIILVKADLKGIVRARKLSQATVRNIKQNLWFAFLYNVLCIPVAAGLFYPVFGLLLNPMMASAAMTLSSVSVIANALRLRTTD